MHRYFAITCTGIFAVLAYIFNDLKNPYNPDIFTAIFVTLTCIATRVKRLVDGNERISTYMEVFLEPKIREQCYWETRIYHKVDGCNSLHIANQKHFKELSHILFFRTSSPYFLLGVTTYVLYLIVLTKDTSLFITYLFTFNTTMFLVLLWSTVLFKSDRKKYIEHWEKVKNIKM